ncbi:MAG: hypothetical protein LBC76_04315 [Treponema sp.]|nr:hypothetical protein [Treponema sp.]
MDRVKDAVVIRLIEQIGKHYQANISNRFIRPLLLQLQLDKNTWDQIELLTEKAEIFSYQGFHLDELYRQIAACARFVEVTRSALIPNIRSKLATVPSGSDKILREMAASNFVSNLQVFTNLLNELYINLVSLDKQSSGKKQPVYNQIPELSNVGRILSGH